MRVPVELVVLGSFTWLASAAACASMRLRCKSTGLVDRNARHRRGKVDPTGCGRTRDLPRRGGMPSGSLEHRFGEGDRGMMVACGAAALPPGRSPRLGLFAVPVRAKRRAPPSARTRRCRGPSGARLGQPPVLGARAAGGCYPAGDRQDGGMARPTECRSRLWTRRARLGADHRRRRVDRRPPAARQSPRDPRSKSRRVSSRKASGFSRPPLNP